MKLSKKEKNDLSEFRVNNFVQIECGNSSFINDNLVNFNISLTDYIANKFDEVEQIKDANKPSIITRVAKTIARIYENISLVTQEEDELIIRTTENIDYDCTSWHVDKDYYDQISNEYEIKKRFIIPLKGKGTNYLNISSETRTNFFNIAKEMLAYWGHGFDGCSQADNINNLLKNENIITTKHGFGSVHHLGKEAVMHSEPTISEPRLVLIVNNINNNNKGN